MSPISAPHKATIKRHLEESLTEGVPLDQVHRELLEIFRIKENYSLAQITAVTSWLRSNILDAKRVQKVDWNEGPDDSNEDANFDNPEKNAARDWQVQQLIANSTLENRREMNYLLLPGKNSYDLEAFTKAGLQGKNLLTYILGEHPKAVAQYVRNCRKYDVQNRRIGEMNQIFPHETVQIRGAYIDYFGQFCPDAATDAHLLPLDPNYYPICVGFNFRKGREHRATKEFGNRARARDEYVDKNQGVVRNGADLTRLYQESTEMDIDNPYDMKELRDDIIYNNMYLMMGVAQQRNWVAPDLVKSFTKSQPGNEDFEDIPIVDQYVRVHEQLRNLTAIVSTVDHYVEKLRIYAWMTYFAAGVCRAVVNSPVVRYLAEPFSYTSGESKKAFQSYFGVLETRKTHYEKYVRAIEFIFALGKILMARVHRFADEGPIELQNLIKVSGIGSQKQITVLDGSKAKPVTEINHDFLLEAQMELGISGCSVRHHSNNNFELLRKNDEEIVESKKSRGRAEETVQKVVTFLSHKFGGVMQHGKIGRNDPCHCGSGKKFKKCCMRC